MRSIPVLLVISLVATTLFATAPASAHTCIGYEPCSAKTCKDGEDHDHTEYVRPIGVQRCRSGRPPAPPPPSSNCKYVVPLPDIVCDIIGPRLVQSMDALAI